MKQLVNGCRWISTSEAKNIQSVICFIHVLSTSFYAQNDMSHASLQSHLRSSYIKAWCMHLTVARCQNAEAM